MNSQASATAPLPWTRSLAVAALVILAGLAAYWPGLSGAFLFDDHSSIVTNNSIRSLWPLGAVLNPPAEAGVAGRPLVNLSYAINHAFSGPSTFGYHITNVALHCLAALVLFGILRRSFLLPSLRDRFGPVSFSAALSVSLLWALHPVQTSSVAYLSQRTEIMMGLALLLTLYAAIRSFETQGRSWSVLAFLACLLGMGCKESMVTAPLLVLFFDRVFVSGSFVQAWRSRKGFYLALASTWVLLALLLFSSRLAERGVGTGLGVSPLDYALTESKALCLYLGLSFWPSPLIFDRGWAYLTHFTDAAPYIAILVAVLLIPLWCAVARHHSSPARLVARGAASNLQAGGVTSPTAESGAESPHSTTDPQALSSGLCFLVLSFFLLLAPTSSIIPIIQQPIAENRLYLPLAFPLLFVIAPLFLWLGRRTLYGCLVLALAFLLLSRDRVQDYRDSLSIWQDTVAKAPDNARAHGNLGAALIEAGREQEAATSLRQALQLRPIYPEASNNLGVVLLHGGQIHESIELFRFALEAKPDFADAAYNLGEALLTAGSIDEAIQSFEATLKLQPTHARAHNNLGMALLMRGRVEEAIRHEERAIQLAPSMPEAHYNLGNALFRACKPLESIAQFQIAAQLRPSDAKTQNNLGAVLLSQGRTAEAIPHFEAALRLRPDYPEARRNLIQAQGTPHR